MRLCADDLTRCRFAVSPLCQTHEALRLLRRPGRHRYHRPWLARTARAAAGLDLADLRLFIPRQGRGDPPGFLGPPPTAAFGIFEDETARLRATDGERARTEMARSLACTPGALEPSRGQRLLRDPAAVRSLADATERAWHTLLAPEWPRIRGVLEADIAYRPRRLAAGGLEALFADLDGRVAWAPDTLTLRVDEVFPGFPVAQRLDGRGVLLTPSVFVWPDVVSGFAPPWQPTVLCPARGIGGLRGRAGRTAPQGGPETRPQDPASQPLSDRAAARCRRPSSGSSARTGPGCSPCSTPPPPPPCSRGASASPPRPSPCTWRWCATRASSRRGATAARCLRTHRARPGAGRRAPRLSAPRVRCVRPPARHRARGAVRRRGGVTTRTAPGRRVRSRRRARAPSAAASPCPA
ncbi:DUF5937 family protein [Streptomyces tremellae]|uniref:DUF5937 domain-containing protein n=1 Tax=Streptomyces tremellae TaxID=1124239 RepID=A0ABP7FWP1_9ACTN